MQIFTAKQVPILHLKTAQQKADYSLMTEWWLMPRWFDCRLANRVVLWSWLETGECWGVSILTLIVTAVPLRNVPLCESIWVFNSGVSFHLFLCAFWIRSCKKNTQNHLVLDFLFITTTDIHTVTGVDNNLCSDVRSNWVYVLFNLIWI